MLCCPTIWSSSTDGYASASFGLVGCTSSTSSRRTNSRSSSGGASLAPSAGATTTPSPPLVGSRSTDIRARASLLPLALAIGAELRYNGIKWETAKRPLEIRVFLLFSYPLPALASQAVGIVQCTYWSIKNYKPKGKIQWMKQEF